MVNPTHPLPRIRFCGPTEHPTPAGYITSCELLEYLLPIWWGGLFCDLGSEIQGHPIDHGSRLGEAATTGQLSECVLVIRDAGEDNELEGFVPREATDPVADTFHRLTPADWSATTFIGLESDLLTGEIFRFDDEPMSWANGKPLFFGWDQAENWLRGLLSPHVLRKPPLGDPAALPDRPYVTLSEAVSWLAYGEALDKRALFARSLSDCGRAVRYAEGGDDVEAETEFGPWFAAYLAALERGEHVRRILRDAMACGELVGRGRCQFPPPKRPSEVKPIPVDVFQLSVHLVLENDGIGIDPLATDPDNDAFLNGMNWKDIRFARHDLERLWGTSAPEESIAVGPTASAAPRKRGAPGRRNQGVVAATEYRRIFPGGHEHLGHSWDTAIVEIANHGAPSVSARTLRRGLKTLQQSKK